MCLLSSHLDCLSMLHFHKGNPALGPLMEGKRSLYIDIP